MGLHIDFFCVLVALVLLLLTVNAAVASTSVGIISPNSLFAVDKEVAEMKDTDIASLHPYATRCPWVFLFYNNGCGHCRVTTPEYTAFARKTWESEGNGVGGGVHGLGVAAINCGEGVASCQQQKVMGVPTVLLFLPLPKSGDTAAAPPTWDISTYMKRVEVDTDMYHLESRVTQLWREHVASTLPGYDVSEGERCANIRRTLVLERAGAIEAKKKAQDANGKAVPFVEEKEFVASDVSNAFLTIVFSEVPLAGMATTDRRTALVDFLQAVNHTLPGLRAEVLLHYLYTHQQKPKGTYAGSSNILRDGKPQELEPLDMLDWQAAVLAAEIPFSGTHPRDLNWQTCRGSSPNYRGFPCGLWLLYHSLSVNADPNLYPGADILNVIYNYSRQFFSCEVCRIHFMRSKFDPMEDAALSLWRVHNIVNGHLAKDASTDPQVPKRQFPTAEMCPTCWDVAEQVYRRAQVSRYLRKRYQWNPRALSTRDSSEENEDIVTIRRDPLGLNVMLSLFVFVTMVLLGVRYGFKVSRRHDEYGMHHRLW